MIDFLLSLLMLAFVFAGLAWRLPALASSLPSFPKCPIRRRHRHSGVTYVGSSPAIPLLNSNISRSIAADLAADVSIHNNGSVWTLTPNKTSAMAWLMANQTGDSSWGYDGSHLIVDHPSALTLASGLESAGFFVHFHQTPKGQS